jgi:ribosomal 50S subunit-associated protein YjgA (DUF615 family)
MGKWNQTFVKAIEKLIDLKIPVDKNMKNLQSFVQLIDAAEKLDTEMYKNAGEVEALKKKFEALKKQQQQKRAAFQKIEAQVGKMVKGYDKALNSLEKANKKLGEQKIVEACTTLKVGLNRIEGLVSLDKKPY